VVILTYVNSFFYLDAFFNRIAKSEEQKSINNKEAPNKYYSMKPANHYL
ncbi:hypothetical protein SE451239_22085, partial [Salmonella enterica subsp. enterica serovar 4 [Salmonella enterica subsp. enterica serovar 4, partial [Salmonella enterica subsp. enterica serovar 4,[5],12:i:- str. 08-1739]